MPLKTRYPGDYEPVDEEDLRKAIEIAKEVLNLCSLADILEPHFEEYQELTKVSCQMATIDLSEPEAP